MLISNLITPIKIFEEDYGVVFDLGFSNDENGIIFSEVEIKKIYDTQLKEYFEIEHFYGKKIKKLNELKHFLEKGIDRTLLVEDFESFEQFTREVLPRYNILMKRPKIKESVELQEARANNNKIICDKVCDILKNNTYDVVNLANGLVGGIEHAFEKTFGDESNKYLVKLYTCLSKKFSKKIPKEPAENEE
jgi:hypothetical protein